MYQIISKDKLIISGFIDREHVLCSEIETGRRSRRNLNLCGSEIPNELSNNVRKFTDSLGISSKSLNIARSMTVNAPSDRLYKFHQDTPYNSNLNHLTLIIYTDVDSSIEDGGTLFDIDVNIDLEHNNELIDYNSEYTIELTGDKVYKDKLLRIDPHHKDNMCKFVIFDSKIYHSAEFINGTGTRRTRVYIIEV